jgi:hypothetical protein
LRRTISTGKILAGLPSHVAWYIRFLQHGLAGVSFCNELLLLRFLQTVGL